MSKQAGKRTGAASVINPDALWMHYAILIGVAVTLLAAIATSWNGLVWLAQQQGLPEWLWWLTPVMIDVPLVVLTFARGALGKRGFRTPGVLIGILALTVYSSVANLAHSLSITGIPSGGLAAVDEILGATTNALAPWLILAMTEVLWLVATKAKPAPVRAKTAPATASVLSTVLMPAQGQVPHVLHPVDQRDPVASLVGAGVS